MAISDYPNSSTEPLGVIEAPTCYAYPDDLVTRRFRRLFNEIAQLQQLVSDKAEEGRDG